MAASFMYRRAPSLLVESFLSRSSSKVLDVLLKSSPCATQKLCKRHLNLHEYVNMGYLREAGIHVPHSQIASTPTEARKLAEDMTAAGEEDYMVKAQVLAGGRGKGHFDSGLQGGVKRVFSPEEAEEVTSKMIGHRLITKQTREDGVPCSKVMITQRLDTKREYYFSIMMDRRHAGPLLIGSQEGGVNIEDVAASNPDAIVQQPVDLLSGLSMEEAQEMAKKMSFRQQYLDSAANTIKRLYDVFIKYDVTMLEINPLSEHANGEVVCMDCKMSYDPNAEYRQQDVFAQRDTSQEDEREHKASDIGLNYIRLDGDIGCLVNGAGLAMATMDIIKLHGGSPANFLDIGGGASVEQITEAFKLITSDPSVNAILVNIFGGIVRCDSVAKGIIIAAEKLRLDMPIIVRLQGTNLQAAKDLMDASSIRIHPYDNLDEAAQRVVVMASIKAIAKQAHVPIEFALPG